MKELLIRLAHLLRPHILTKESSPEGRGFKLKLHEKDPTAPLSPIYVNLRGLSLGLTRVIGETMAEYARERSLKFNAVIGIPNAAEPIAVRFVPAFAPRKSLLQGRKQEASGDNPRRILPELSGEFGKGDIVLVLDDVITGADTKLEMVEVLRGFGLRVHDLLVIVDREQGGVATLARHNVQVHSLFTLSGLLGIYRDEGSLSQEEFDEIIEYLTYARPA